MTGEQRHDQATASHRTAGGDPADDEVRRASERGWTSARLGEDVQFGVVEGGPVGYRRETGSAVEHVTVADGDGILGYLGACDADGAAGWQVRPAGGDTAYNAGVARTLKPREAKVGALPPRACLQRPWVHHKGRGELRNPDAATVHITARPVLS